MIACSSGEYVKSVIIGNTAVVVTSQNNQHIISAYPLPTACTAPTIIDTADASTCTTINDVPFIVHQLLAHPELNCVSIISSNIVTSKKSKKSAAPPSSIAKHWTKFNPVTNDIQCTMPLPSSTLTAFSILSSLYVVTASDIAVYDIKYGLVTSNISTSLSSTLITPSLSHETVLYYEYHAAGATTINKLVIPTPQVSTLASTMAKHKAAVPDIDLSNGKILNGVSSGSKRKLQSIVETPQTVTKEYSHMNSHKYVSYAHIDIDDSIVTVRLE